MATRYEMSWEGAPAYRWVKMYKGTRYRVTCQELGAMVWTKEATGQLANQWWRRKQAELLGPVDPFKFTEEKKAEVMDYLETARQQPERMAKVAAVATGTAPPTGTFKEHCERFLQVEGAELKPTGYTDLVRGIRAFYRGRESLDVRAIDEGFVEQEHISIRQNYPAAATRKKRWGFFKRLVKYLYSKRLMAELPRNLDTLPGFKVRAKKVKTWPVETVRATVAGLPARERSWALLALNCGMTAADIGQLTKDMVDLKAGTLTRKRVKTEDHAEVPTVTYRLWPETLEALKANESSDPALWFLTGTGKPLWRDNGQGRDRTDMILSWWDHNRNGTGKKADLPFPFHALRSIGSTELEKHENYGRYALHYLGQSPKSIMDKHYKAPSQKVFDAAMDWLRVQILGDTDLMTDPEEMVRGELQG